MRECKVCRKKLEKPKNGYESTWGRRLCPQHNEYVKIHKGGEPWSTPDELRKVKDFKRGK